jgi:hypothetical protein
MYAVCSLSAAMHGGRAQSGQITRFANTLLMRTCKEIKEAKFGAFQNGNSSNIADCLRFV